MSATTHPLERVNDRVRGLNRRPVVVKLGGSTLDDATTTQETLRSLGWLWSKGVQLVVVHGGGKAIDRAMAAAGLIPVKVQGRRYTDDDTLALVVRELQGLSRMLADGLAVDGVLVTQFEPDDFPIRGRRLLLPGLDLQPVDLGRVGRPTAVDGDRLTELVVGEGEVPVLPSLAVSEDDGGWLNVNADTAASAVAGALKAAACLFLTDTPGVLRSISDPGSLLPRLTRAEANALIADGTVGGGMVPKLEACFEALDAGAGSAAILDGRNPHALLDWFLGEPAGTEIVP